MHVGTRTNTEDLWVFWVVHEKHHTHIRETAEHLVWSQSQCRQRSYWNVRLLCSTHTQSCVMLNVRNVAEERFQFSFTEWEQVRGVYTYAGTGRQLWLGCAPDCPPPRYWTRRRCPSSVSWYELDLDDKGRRGERGSGSSIHMKYLNVVTPTLDRDAKKKSGETEWRRPEWGDRAPPENTQEGNRQTWVHSYLQIILSFGFDLQPYFNVGGVCRVSTVLIILATTWSQTVVVSYPACVPKGAKTNHKKYWQTVWLEKDGQTLNILCSCQ